MENTTGANPIKEILIFWDLTKLTDFVVSWRFSAIKFDYTEKSFFERYYAFK